MSVTVALASGVVFPAVVFGIAVVLVLVLVAVLITVLVAAAVVIVILVVWLHICTRIPTIARHQALVGGAGGWGLAAFFGGRGGC
jgi:hypothetical protein